MGWESQYPQYPRLDTPEANAGIDEAWSSRDTGHPLWDAAVLREVFRRSSKGEPIDDPLVLKSLALFSASVTLGRAWDEVVKLPGRGMSAEWLLHSPTDRGACRLYLHVMVKMAQGAKVGTAIASVSLERHCSPEKVRKAYDVWRKGRVSEDAPEYGDMLMTLVREMEAFEDVPSDLRRDTSERLIELVRKAAV